MSLLKNVSGLFSKVLLEPLNATSHRRYSKGSLMKVAVLGAAGKVGQPLSLLLKQSTLIDELALMDVKGTCGLGLELGHIDTKCRVYAYTGFSNIKECLTNAKIVVIVAAAANTSLMSHHEMFDPNVKIIKELGEICAEFCPNAFFAISTDPINSLVPVFSEIIKKEGQYNPNAIFGITTLDVVRANTFVADTLGLDPECVIVPIIGGHGGQTIVPVLSQTKPYPDFKKEELEVLTKSIQNAHEYMVKIKKTESVYLSGAFAIARFIVSLVKAIRGQPNVIECAYVRSNESPAVRYLSTPLRLGIGGVETNLGIPPLTDYENCLFEKALKLINADIKRGELFLGIDYDASCDPCDPNPESDPCPPDFCDEARRKLN